MGQTLPDKELVDLLEEILAFFHKARRNCKNYRSLGKCCGLVGKSCENAGYYCNQNCLCHIVSGRHSYLNTPHTDGQMLSLFVDGCFPHDSAVAIYRVCGEVNINAFGMPDFLEFASRIRDYDRTVLHKAIEKYTLLDKLNNE